ncbi:MAG TPA: hypothetical protein VG269_21980 [Tepidisphaeraceae bacterium]|jgi:hypothetical protein|nr:hypothetical protein [Tepidisphaeraceae bacterium]
MISRPLYLCGGLQSSGSTLVSWCFLQRADMDGVLDARFDTLPQMPADLSCSLAWCKFTIACFRFTEVMEYMQDEGWQVRPLLVVRDVRSVFNSLITKSYGRNGITADDPPVRLRLLRFLEDWTEFRRRGWPIFRFEDLASDPIMPLRSACEQLGLPYENAMASWPKARDQIADARYGNEKFLKTRGATLQETVVPSLIQVKTPSIPHEDLAWMESRFAEMNRVMGYPRHVAAEALPSPARAVPRFENTRRCERLRRKNRLSQSLRKWADMFLKMMPIRRSPKNARRMKSRQEMRPARAQ